MTRSVKTIDSAASVQEAAKTMKSADVGMLPVLDHGRVVGVVTDRDLVVRAWGMDKPDSTVRDAMSSEAICINQDCDIDEAIQKMEGRKIGRLVVENELGNIVGVLTAADIAIVCSGDQRVGRLAASLARAHRHVGQPTIF